MKVNSLKLVLTPAALASLLGAAASGYTPISCGCLSPVDALAGQLDLRDLPSSDSLRISGAFTRKYTGKHITLESLPGYEECAKLSPSLFRCTYWLWEKPGMERGIEVTVSTTTSGVFTSASTQYVIHRVAEKPPG